MPHSHVRFWAPALLVSLALATACQQTAEESTTPSEANEEEFVGAGGGDYRTEEQKLDEKWGGRAALGARPTATEQCEGEPKVCKLVDPDPGTSAAHGARAVMGNVRWGMSPEIVLEQLEKRMKTAHQKSMAQTSDVGAQDEARRAFEDAVKQLPTRRVKLDTANEGRWATTFLSSIYKKDDGEELIFMGEGMLREFYLFREGKLWQVVQAHSKGNWPGKNFEQVIAEKFKKDFGHGPETKEDRDEKSTELKLLWYEWTSSDGDRVRAYDLLKAHGVVAISVVQGSAEDSYGVRLPNNELDAAFREENLSEVMKDAGLCYDADGNMVQDQAQCAENQEEAAAKSKDKKGKKGKKGKK